MLKKNIVIWKRVKKYIITAKTKYQIQQRNKWGKLIYINKGQ